MAKKMSTRKRKTSPSNLQFDYDKEISILQERLIDNVVSEVTSHSSVLQSQQVNESNDDALGINSFPNEILLKVFGYLKHNQLGQIARVCKRWNVLTKSPVLWKKVDVEFHWSHRSQNAVTWCLVKMLPPCVTHIRINFSERTERWDEQLNFAELCMRLQRRCSCLKTLILKGVLLSYNLCSVIDLCTHFLKDVKILGFHHSRFLICRVTGGISKIQILDRFLNCHLTGECYAGGISKIEILDISDCYFELFDYDIYVNKPPFSKMPYLKHLHLSKTNIKDSWFEDDTSFSNQLHMLNLSYTYTTFRIFTKMQNHGLNLKELYLCKVYLQVRDVNFNNSVFPHLETICLRNYCVRCEPIISLIQSCQSLQNVYVNDSMVKTFTEHPIVVSNRCISGIVKAIGPYHNHNVDYFHK